MENNKVPTWGRRKFLQVTGIAAGAGLIAASTGSLTSCKKSPDDTIYIGSGDTALLNYLYIMEQIIAGFYTQANLTTYYGLTASEMQLLADLRDHQYVHLALLRKLLGSWAVPDLDVYHAPTTYANRTSTLTNGIYWEDLAVAAYNGVAKVFTDTNLTLLTIKMGTVQARHSAYQREILNHNTYTDATVVDSDGMGKTLPPSTVIKTLMNYCSNKFDISKLPS